MKVNDSVQVEAFAAETVKNMIQQCKCAVESLNGYGENKVNLQMIKQCLCLCFLYQLARQDCRWKKMDAGLLYGFLAVGAGCFMLEFLLNTGKGSTSTTISLLFLSLLPGFFFLIMGAVTQEAVGYGDGLSILAMGFYMEAYVLWKAVGIGLVFVMFYIGVREFTKKHGYEQEQKHKREQRAVPFLPFLLTGMVVMLGVL